jgi:hypothetical protein
MDIFKIKFPILTKSENIYTKEFLRNSLWDYNNMCNYIINYSGIPQFDSYMILHQGYDCSHSCQLNQDLGLVTSFTPVMVNTKNTQISNALTEQLLVNVYGLVTGQQINDFHLSLIYGAAFNFSNTNNVERYINVPYYQTFSGFTATYSYGLFYPEVKAVSADITYNYVIDISGNNYNKYLKKFNNGTSIYKPASFDLVTNNILTYDIDGFSTWATDNMKSVESWYYFASINTNTETILSPVTPDSLQKTFVGPITPTMLSLMPQMERRYCISFVYNRTQRMLNFFLNNLSNNTNTGSNIGAYNSVPGLNTWFYYNNTYAVDQLDLINYSPFGITINGNSNIVYSNTFLTRYSNVHTQLLTQYNNVESNVKNYVNNSWQRISYGTIIQIATLYSFAYTNQFLDSNGVMQTNPQSNPIQSNYFYDFLVTYPLPTICSGNVGYLGGWVNITDTTLHESVNIFTYSSIPKEIVTLEFLRYMASLLPSIQTISLQKQGSWVDDTSAPPHYYTLYLFAGVRSVYTWGTTNIINNDNHINNITQLYGEGVYFFTRQYYGTLPRPLNQ